MEEGQAPLYPISTTSFVSPVWLRDDLPRAHASEYWAGPHAAIARQLQNVFQRVLGQPTPPGGGRWWTDGFDDTVGQRVALLLGRRRGVRGALFRRFVHDRIGPALFAAGARNLRTYTFLPWSRFMHITPGVSHDNPPDRRYHGAAVFGTGSRAAIDGLLGSADVAEVVAGQHTVLTAVHAYAVERSVPAKRVPK